MANFENFMFEIRTALQNLQAFRHRLNSGNREEMLHSSSAVTGAELVMQGMYDAVTALYGVDSAEALQVKKLLAEASVLHHTFDNDFNRGE